MTPCQSAVRGACIRRILLPRPCRTRRGRVGSLSVEHSAPHGPTAHHVEPMPVQITPTSAYDAQLENIQGDFDDPLEVIREAISNACDAGSKDMHIYIFGGGVHSSVVILDAGSGMDHVERDSASNSGCRGSAKSSLASFFDLGNSTREIGKNIGHKCLGSKLLMSQVRCPCCRARLPTHPRRRRARRLLGASAPSGRCHWAFSLPGRPRAPAGAHPASTLASERQGLHTRNEDRELPEPGELLLH